MKCPFGFTQKGLFATVTKVVQPEVHRNDDLGHQLSLAVAGQTTHRHWSVCKSTDQSNQAAKERNRPAYDESENPTANGGTDPRRPMRFGPSL